MKKIYLAVKLGLLTMLSANAQQTYTTFQSANLVIGQPSFTTQNSVTDQSTTYGSNASAISCKGVLAVACQYSNRVLIWNSVPSSNGVPADVVIGQSTFTSGASGCSQNQFNIPYGIAFSPDGKKLIVSDLNNNRVLIWNSIPTVNGQNADVVIGQVNFTTATSGLAADKMYGPFGVYVSADGKLFVCETFNRRVLIFNTIPTSNGVSADVVVGQPNFTSNGSGSAANQLASADYCAVSPTGKLLISDEINHRVLVYNSVPTTNGASANVVIGQTGFGLSTTATTASNLAYPVGVTCSPDGKLAIGEFGNHRVLIFNSIPTSNGASADAVLGQPNFTSSTSFNGGVNNQSMSQPFGINFDLNNRLFVNGRGMHRVMIFGTVPTQTAELSVSMSPSSTSLCLGSQITYSIDLTNNGPSTASNVVVSTAMPALFTPLYGNLTPGTSYNFWSGLWTIPSLASGSTAIIRVTGTVNTSVPQVMQAYANIVNSQQYDNLLSNNGVASSVNVSSSSPPGTGVITGPSSICAGGTYPFAVNGVTNASTYNWSCSSATIVGTGSLVSITFGYVNPYINVLPSNNNCSGVPISQQFYVNALPNVSVTSSSPLLCSGNSATLTASGAVTYSWSTNTTGNSIFVAPTVSTLYSVIGYGANGCNNTFIINQVVSPCTGINGNSLDNVVARAYPNPSNSMITVESINSIEKIEVFDLNGKIVLTENNAGTNKITMNVGSLNNSVYLLRVKLVSGEVSNTRIVVQK